ncbi:MAG: hypothetical protein RBR66_01090 [Candidatus Izemoplasmatales bacterium]|jgi:hypothetical protein|nr:hypothetical protein [Candidatus Izemoplasmatales bacterium]
MEKNIELEKLKNDYLTKLSSQDGLLYVKSLLEYTNILIENREYEETIKVLETALNQEKIEDLESRLNVINKLLNILLKLEDYPKLKSLLDYRKGFIYKESDLLMQEFYLAVCYEGLNDFNMAISTLINIKDNISNQNLVNKYLKLSMLYLNVNEKDNAKSAYERALIFDKKKKNTTFILTECDLLFSEKNYLKALEKYEEYYLLSKNKYRYLDRYIKIQIALKQYAEAYSFYKKHLPIMKRVLSKSARLDFYNAALELLKKLNNEIETTEINQLIFEINKTLVPFVNIHDYSLNLLKKYLSISLDKPREIIRTLFMETDNTKLFSKLVYVKLESDQVNMFHFTKNLLLEKRLEDIDKTIYQDIKNLNYHQIITKNSFSSYPNDPFLNKDNTYVFINEVGEFEYFVFYVNSEDFNLSKKVFDFNKVIYQKFKVDWLKHGLNVGLRKNLLLIFNALDYAVMLIKENTLQLLNKQAKNLLKTSKDYLSMEEFQSSLVKNVYVDELLNTDEIILKYQTDEIINIDFKVFKDELNIYLLGKRVESNTQTKRFLDYKFIYEEKVVNDNSMILVNIRDYHDFMKDYSYQRYENFLDKFFKLAMEVSRNYFQNLYLEGMDNLFLILKTKDKRIIKRIYEDLLKGIGQETDLRFSLVNLKDSVTKEDLDDLKFLNSLTTKENNFISDNKNYRLNKEVAKTILENIQKLLENNNLKLSFSPIKNWQLNKTRFLYVDLLSRVLLGNKASLKRVIKANDLEKEWDELLINQLIKETRLANFKGKFLIELSLKTIAERAVFTKIKRKLANKGFNNSSLIYIIDYQDYLDYNDLVLPEENFAFYNVFANFKIKNIADLNLMNYIIIKADEMKDDGFKIFEEIIINKEMHVIYDHQKTSLTKSFLEENKFVLVMGEAYGFYDSLKQVKKLEDL